MSDKNKSTNYVDPKRLLAEMSQYRKEYEEWLDRDDDSPKPPLTDSIGSMIIEICTRLSYSPRFINYTFRDEMVGCAIETCIRYAHNFNPEKTDKAFGYFTTIAYWSNVSLINDYHKDRAKKAKYLQLTLDDDEILNGIHSLNESTGLDNDNQPLMKYLYDYYNVDYTTVEKPKKVKKPTLNKKVKKQAVSLFETIDSEDENNNE